MSVELTRLAWAVRGLKPSERIVLLYAADIARAEHENAMWAKQSTIAEVCELNAHTVKTALRELCKKGHLQSNPRPNKPTRFVVTPQADPVDIAPGGNCTGSEPDAETGGNHTAHPVEFAPATRCDFHPRTIIEPYIEPSSTPVTYGDGVERGKGTSPRRHAGSNHPSWDEPGNRQLHDRFLARLRVWTGDVGFGAQRAVAARAGMSEQHLWLALSGRLVLSRSELESLDAARAALEMEGVYRLGNDPVALRVKLKAYLEREPAGAQERLSRSSGIHTRVVSRFKHGVTNLTPANRAKIAAALPDVSPPRAAATPIYLPQGETVQ